MTPLHGLFAAISADHPFPVRTSRLQPRAPSRWRCNAAVMAGARHSEPLDRFSGRGRWRTAVVQSSSAITALTVTLVDAAVISFRASLGVLLGANVGTTATAWLVSFKLTGIGPMFIVLGALISALPVRMKVIGKALFYFGLIFFTLDLISAELKPLQSHAGVQTVAGARGRSLGGSAGGPGFHGTGSIQQCQPQGWPSSWSSRASFPEQAAIPIVIGANVGSTSTALMASVGMSPVARATGITNFLFNAAGALLYLPFLRPFSQCGRGHGCESWYCRCVGASPVQSLDCVPLPRDPELGGAPPPLLAVR